MSNHFLSEPITVGLAVRKENEDALRLAKEVVEWARSKECQVIAAEDLQSDKALSVDQYQSRQQLAENANLIVTLGGDGTLISVGRHCGKENPLLLGVNFGTLGFLTEIYPAECLEYLNKAIANDVQVGKRALQKVQVIRNGDVHFVGQALNEALIQKGTRDRMIELDIGVDDEQVMVLKGDGVIISTPTGSTAYSLAAGGAIAHPKLSVFLLSPICAHSLNARPLILPDLSEVTITIPKYEGETFLSLDGQEWCSLESHDVVKVTRSPHTVQFVKSESRSYFEILRNKLRWGAGNVY